MEDASKVMYKIANVFNWLALVLGVLFIILSIVFFANPNTPVNGQTDPESVTAIAVTFLVLGIWWIILPLVLIFTTRRAYAKESSQNWDIVFLILGILSGSLFYILGGAFGIAAKGN
jgi:uncharacterized membrane protein HdeD (DUF308 family)